MPAFPKHAHTFTESTSPPLGLFIMAALHVCLLIQTNVAWPHLLNQVWLQLLVTVKGWRSVRCCGGRGRDLVWLGSLLLWRTSSHSAGAAEADVAEICNDWKSNVCSRWEVEHSHTHTRVNPCSRYCANDLFSTHLHLSETISVTYTCFK